MPIISVLESSPLLFLFLVELFTVIEDSIFMIIRLGIWDPALERFSTVDPHTEKYYSWSPYHYAANNPIIKDQNST